MIFCPEEAVTNLPPPPPKKKNSKDDVRDNIYILIKFLNVYDRDKS
jgi:hypothetical protein